MNHSEGVGTDSDFTVYSLHAYKAKEKANKQTNKPAPQPVLQSLRVPS